MNCITEVKESALAVSALYSIAGKLLERDGQVALGTLFSSLRHGNGAYDGIPTKLAGALTRLSEAEARAVYELTLEKLEQEYGPLWCENPEEGTSSDVVWGYASLIEQQSVRTPVVPKSDYRLDRRFEAFDQGHPDRICKFDQRLLPTTIWHRSATKIAA